MSSIIHISQMASIALHSMVVISNTKELLNVKKIAEVTGAPESHLSKVLQRLVKAGFIRSVRGPKGGFALLKSPSEITFLDIYEATEGSLATKHCPSNCQVCSFNTCILGGIPEKLNNEFIDYLRQKNLSDFLEI
ncbi:MAG: Rrf2 family transcriptional regulator [Clostridiaceae bacterium]|nr:Rrf2 family transcriptional regulator [Clostridiaceae bacterium]